MSAHMSGWDVSSTPTWGPQDGPEDTQAFTGQDFGGQEFGRGGPGSPAGGFPEAGGFPGESQAGGPPPEFFGQEPGQEQELGPGGFPQRTPGGSFQNLPRREARGRHSSAPAAAAAGSAPATSLVHSTAAKRPTTIKAAKSTKSAKATHSTKP